MLNLKIVRTSYDFCIYYPKNHYINLCQLNDNDLFILIFFSLDIVRLRFCTDKSLDLIFCTY